MKYFFTILFLTYLNFFYAQESDTTKEPVIFSINFEQKKEKAIEIFADSINNFNGKDVPNFLYNPCLDLTSTFRLGFHDLESKRWRILNNVNNIEALQSILKINDKRLQKVCKNKKNWSKKTIKEFNLIELSFYEMIQKRIDQLEYIKNLEGNDKKRYERDLLIESIADDLNSYNFDDCRDIPDFFNEYDFDTKIGSKYWVSPQAAVSLRKFIIEKIDNYQLLLCVLNSKNVNIHISYRIHRDSLSENKKIPFEQFSTFDLVKYRFEEIENKNKMLIGILD